MPQTITTYVAQIETPASTICKSHKIHTNQSNHRGICKKKKEKKKETSRHTKRRSVNKNDAKKPFVTNASDSYTSDTQVTRVNTPISSHTL